MSIFLSFLLDIDWQFVLIVTPMKDALENIHRCSGSSWRLDLSLGSHRAGRSQCRDAFSRLISHLGGNLRNTILDVINHRQGGDDAFADIGCTESDGGFVQVDSDKRYKVDSDYIPAFGDTLSLFCMSFLHNKST